MSRRSRARDALAAGPPHAEAAPSPTVVTLDDETFRRCQRLAALVVGLQQTALAAQQAFQQAYAYQRWVFQKAGLDPDQSWALDDEARTATAVPARSQGGV